MVKEGRPTFPRKTLFIVCAGAVLLFGQAARGEFSAVLTLTGDAANPSSVFPGTPITVTVWDTQGYNTYPTDGWQISFVQLRWADSSGGLNLMAPLGSTWTWGDAILVTEDLEVDDSNMSDGIVTRVYIGDGVSPGASFSMGTLAFTAPAATGAYTLTLTGGANPPDQEATCTAIAHGEAALLPPGIGSGLTLSNNYSITVVAGGSWTGNSNTQWHNPANWSSNMTPGSTFQAVFDGTPPGSQPTLFKGEAVQSVDLRTPGWTIGGSSYTLTVGTGGISSAGSGSNTIQPTIAFTGDAAVTVGTDNTLVLGATSIAAGATLTKTGAGSVTFGGAQNHGAGAVLQVGGSDGGVVNLNTNAGALSPGSGTPTVANLLLRITGGTGGGNSKVVLGSDQVLAGLDVQNATGGLQELNLNDKAVQVFPANVAALEQAIRTMVSAGITSGEGIYDSMAAADERVGYTDQRWDLDAAQYVAIRTVYGGDANMDGSVDGADLALLATNYDVVSGMTWDLGDFNYDGQIDGADLAILATNYDKTGGNHVPEPATLALLGLGLSAMVLRRRAGK